FRKPLAWTPAGPKESANAVRTIGSQPMRTAKLICVTSSLPKLYGGRAAAATVRCASVAIAPSSSRLSAKLRARRASQGRDGARAACSAKELRYARDRVGVLDHAVVVCVDLQHLGVRVRRGELVAVGGGHDHPALWTEPDRRADQKDGTGNAVP